MAEPKSNPVLEAVMQLLLAAAAVALTLPQAEREILKRRVLDKAWTLANRVAQWLAGRSMTLELRTGVNAVGYSIAGCQSITLNGCGAESILAGSGGDGSSFKIGADTSGENSYCVTLNGCWCYNNDAVAFNVAANQNSVTLITPIENTPLAGATASIQTGSGSSVTILGESYTTATNLASGTTTTLQDGSGDVTIPGQINITNGAAIKFGAALDTDLYRLAAGSLATDGHLTSFGSMSPGGAGNVTQGSGAPSKPAGNNPTAGDIWFRTDTPSTSDQRIYICTTGGASPVWAGIV